MLSVNINRDVEQYQESVAFGLNARQSIFALLTIIVGVAVTCLLHFLIGLPMEVSIYISLPICMPVMLPALGKNHGISVAEQLKQSNKHKKVLAYAAAIPEERKDKQIDEEKEKQIKGNERFCRKKAQKNPKKRSFSQTKKQR